MWLAMLCFFVCSLSGWHFLFIGTAKIFPPNIPRYSIPRRILWKDKRSRRGSYIFLCSLLLSISNSHNCPPLPKEKSENWKGNNWWSGFYMFSQLVIVVIVLVTLIHFCIIDIFEVCMIDIDLHFIYFL